MRPGNDWKSSRALRHSAASTGGEDMALDRLHDVGVQVGRVAGDAERAVAAVAAGAAGDLADLRRCSARVRRPSNLRRPAKATWSTSRFSPMPMASVATR